VSEEAPLAGVLQAVRRVVSETKTGSAIDRYRIEYLWDLGDALIRRGGVETGGVPGADSVLDGLRTEGLSLYPTVLKNAVRVRRYWPDRASYAAVANSLSSYGKLKDVIQLFDPAAELPRAELDSFLSYAASATYVDTLERAGRLKARFIKRVDSEFPDTDTLAENVHEAADVLKQMIESGNEDAIRSVRDVLTPDRSRDLRLLISALQNPDVYTRYDKQVRVAKLPSPEELEIRGHSKLGEVVRILTPLRMANPKLFPQIATEVGRPYLGELATLLKAIGSTEEQDRYLKNQEVLRRFIYRAGGPS
jgi:hypothetical protein